MIPYFVMFGLVAGVIICFIQDRARERYRWSDVIDSYERLMMGAIAQAA